MEVNEKDVVREFEALSFSIGDQEMAFDVD